MKPKRQPKPDEKKKTAPACLACGTNAYIVSIFGSICGACFYQAFERTR